MKTKFAQLMVGVAVTTGLGVWCQAEDPCDEAPHFYSQTAPDDPVGDLAKALDQEQKALPEGTDRELMSGILKELGVSPHSQVLVFSKTSLQRDKITPSNPRALYFSDEIYLGWVPGGLMEFTGVHPTLGSYFYSLDPEAPSRPRRIVRQTNCLTCHGGGMTDHWPGLMIRSVFTDDRGFPLLQAGTVLVDHATPVKDRWGGWYVTGQHGDIRHMGNSIAKQEGADVTLDREKFPNIKELKGTQILNEGEYLGKGSDIVALMTLEHQITMVTRITAASYEVRGAISRMQALQKDLGEPVTDTLQGSAKSVAESHLEKVMKALLFCEEAPLPQGGIEGNTEFQDSFRDNRKKGAGGDSLKDFQLLNRLFKFRCSYMIYTRSWNGLPMQFKQMVYARLKEILTAEEPPAPYTHLGKAEREAITKILQETHPEIAAAWAK